MMVSLLQSPSFYLQLERKSHASQLNTVSPNTGRWHTFKPRGGLLHLRRKTLWRPLCAERSSGPSEPPNQLHDVSLSPSPSTMIRDFYLCINDKSQNYNELDKFITDDCLFEDLAFPEPFRGKKEVHSFLKELRDAMGKHVTFNVESVYEGQHKIIQSDHLAVSVLWHLEWNGSPIPFTKGCTFYECSRTGNGILIKKARVFEESPIKPGEFVLELLKIISSIFDKFPGLAERCLQTPHTMMVFILKLYKIFVEPFILPLVVYYTHLWTYAARVIGGVLNLVITILKIFM